MNLRVAVQMDPLEQVNIEGDSTFAIMLGAQLRGHRLFHYAAEDLNYSDGRLWTRARPVTVQRVHGDHHRFGEEVSLDLVTRSLDEARSFLAEHGEIVVKPLHGNGGKAVFKVGRDGANLASLIEVFNTAYREPHMVQAFLPGVAEGDKRIVLVDGEVAGAVNRIPGEGEIRSNLAVGGKAAKTDLTEREREICSAIGAELKARGLLFVGIDVIGGQWLTEINVTSPTGIVAIDKFNGTDTPALIWDAIESKLR